jgi:hypothetical protein
LALGIFVDGFAERPDIGLRQIQVRFDAEEVVVDTSIRTTAGTILLLNVHKYTPLLLTHSTLRIRYRGLSGVWTYSFQLAGLREAMAAHPTLCGPLPEN